MFLSTNAGNRKVSALVQVGEGAAKVEQQVAAEERVKMELILLLKF